MAIALRIIQEDGGPAIAPTGLEMRRFKALVDPDRVTNDVLWRAKPPVQTRPDAIIGVDGCEKPDPGQATADEFIGDVVCDLAPAQGHGRRGAYGRAQGPFDGLATPRAFGSAPPIGEGLPQLCILETERGGRSRGRRRDGRERGIRKHVLAFQGARLSRHWSRHRLEAPSRGPGSPRPDGPPPSPEASRRLRPSAHSGSSAPPAGKRRRCG